MDYTSKLAKPSSYSTKDDSPPSGILYLWSKIYGDFSDVFGQTVFNSWLKYLVLHSYSNGKIVISAPNRFTADWVETHYKDRILNIFQFYNENAKDITFIIDEDNKNKIEISKISKSEKTRKTYEIYTSEGPGVRIKGTAWQIYNKYQELAKEAMLEGDEKLAESYMQHAVFYHEKIHNPDSDLANKLIDSVSKSNTIEDKENYYQALSLMDSHISTIKSVSESLIYDTDNFLQSEKDSQKKLEEIISNLKTHIEHLNSKNIKRDKIFKLRGKNV